MLRTARLFLALCLATTACSGQITSSKKLTGFSTLSDTKVDARAAAKNLIASVNSARVSLSQNRRAEAGMYVAGAQNLLGSMRNTTTPGQIGQISSGRMSYGDGYHYFPIQAGPIEIKTFNRPASLRTGNLAVTDADIVYVTVDLGDKGEPEALLAHAREAIAADDLAGAERDLAQLTSRIIHVDSRIPLPVEKARDNMILAERFIDSGNLTAARYALGHAGEALSALERDPAYFDRKEGIVTMRQELEGLQAGLNHRHPQLPDGLPDTISAWADTLRSWRATAAPFPNA